MTNGSNEFNEHFLRICSVLGAVTDADAGKTTRHKVPALKQACLIR